MIRVRSNHTPSAEMAVDPYACIRQLIFLEKSDCLGCVALLCFVVCLTLLASFFLLHLSLNMSNNTT